MDWQLYKTQAYAMLQERLHLPSANVAIKCARYFRKQVERSLPPRAHLAWSVTWLRTIHVLPQSSVKLTTFLLKKIYTDFFIILTILFVCASVGRQENNSSIV